MVNVCGGVGVGAVQVWRSGLYYTSVSDMIEQINESSDVKRLFPDLHQENDIETLKCPKFV